MSELWTGRPNSGHTTLSLFINVLIYLFHTLFYKEHNTLIFLKIYKYTITVHKLSLFVVTFFKVE